MRRPRQEESGFPLALFVRRYLFAWLITLGGLLLLPPLAPFLYLFAGYYLNRSILPHLKWHKYTVTMADVARAKVQGLLFWPVVYARLIVHVLILRYL